MLYYITLLSDEISKLAEFHLRYFHADTPILGGDYLAPKAFWQYDGIEILYEE